MHGLQQLWVPSSRAQVQDLPGSGIELVSPALSGGFFTAEPPGKPDSSAFELSIWVEPCGPVLR